MASTLIAGNATNSGVSLTGAVDGILEIKTGSGAGTTAVTVSTGQVVTLANALPIASGGTGLTSTPANGALDIGNGTGFTRTTLTQGSGITITNGAGSITIAASGGGGGFSSGTVMLFVQTAAPTGWTKSTTHDNKALRVVSGNASTGGSVAFTTAFAASLTAGNTTLSTAQIPSHTHGGAGGAAGQGAGVGDAQTVYGGGEAGGATGGGGSHNHTIPSFAVAYVDVIIATAN